MERLGTRRARSSGLTAERLDLGNAEEQILIPPTAYLDACRRVLGSIDLDPCSTAKAQAAIEAQAWYRAEEAQAALAEPWRGRVFLHPHPNVVVGRYQIQKLIRDYLADRVSSAIILGGRVDALRQEPLLLSFPFLIHYRRLKMWRLMPDGQLQGHTPSCNTISHYLPAKDGHAFNEERLSAFLEAFSPFGRVLLSEDFGDDWQQDALLASARMPIKPVLTRSRLERYTARAEQQLRATP
jgi:hypothetical protein